MDYTTACQKNTETNSKHITADSHRNNLGYVRNNSVAYYAVLMQLLNNEPSDTERSLEDYKLLTDALS